MACGHLQRWGCLLTCWAHERKHKVVKRYATQINNSRAYEQSVLREVISHYLNDLRSPGHFRKTAYLEEPHKANAKLIAFLIRELEMDVDPDSCDQSSHARLGLRGPCQQMDVVLVKPGEGESYAVGEVWQHCSLEGIVMSITSMWEFLSYDAHKCCVCCGQKDKPELVFADDVLRTTTWWQLADSARVSVSYPFRP